MALMSSRSRYAPVRPVGKPWLFLLLLGGLSAVFGVLLLYDPRMALFAGAVVVAAPLVLYISIRNPATPLQIALILMPLLYSPVLNPPLLGISGMKPWTLLAAAACGVAFFDSRLYAAGDKIERVATRLFFLYLAVWIFIFLRSIANVGLFYTLAPTKFPDSQTYYFFKDFAVPLLYTLFFLLIIKMARTERQIDSFVRVVGLSMFVFSLAVLMVGVIEFGALTDSRKAWAIALETHLGLGYNTAGTVYLITGPLLLYLALRRGPFWLANFALALVAILLLQSRSSMMVFVLACAAFLVLTGRTRLLVGVAALLGVSSIFLVASVGLPPSIEAMISVGIDDSPGESWTMNALLADRLAMLWEPLLAEWFSDPTRLLIGGGRYSIMTSMHYARGYFLGTHPHNALIEAFLDGGIFVAGAFLIGTIWFIRRGWRLARRTKDPLFWSLLCCIGGYLVASLTERSFFPAYDNFAIFPIIALTVCVARLRVAELGAQSPSPPEPSTVGVAPRASRYPAPAFANPRRRSIEP